MEFTQTKKIIIMQITINLYRTLSLKNFNKKELTEETIENVFNKFKETIITTVAVPKVGMYFNLLSFIDDEAYNFNKDESNFIKEIAKHPSSGQTGYFRIEDIIFHKTHLEINII